MSETPRVNAITNTGRNLNPATDFTKLAATYSDLLQLARDLERELAEKSHALSDAIRERGEAVAKMALDVRKAHREEIERITGMAMALKVVRDERRAIGDSIETSLDALSKNTVASKCNTAECKYKRVDGEPCWCEEERKSGNGVGNPRNLRPIREDLLDSIGLIDSGLPETAREAIKGAIEKLSDAIESTPSQGNAE